MLKEWKIGDHIELAILLILTENRPLSMLYFGIPGRK